jgi:hypothetical protein
MEDAVDQDDGFIYYKQTLTRAGWRVFLLSMTLRTAVGELILRHILSFISDRKHARFRAHIT